MAPKKRGLKASSKSAPAPTPAVDAPTRTFPLDEDALTIADLFELRTNAHALLLSPSSTADQQEEARGLLRGILHGSQSLVDFFASAAPSTPFFSVPHPTPTESAGDQEERLTALGLRRPRAPSQIAYLQAWALHELASILPPPPSAAASALAEGPAKKRKIDHREPTRPEEWLDEALEKYEVAAAWIPAVAGLVEGAEERHWEAVVESDWARGRCDRAVLAFLAGEEDEGKTLLEGTSAGLAKAAGSWSAYKTSGTTSEQAAEWVDERGDASAVVLRALGAFLAVADGFLGQDGLVDVQTVKDILATGEFGLVVEGEVDEEMVRKRELEGEILKGDAAMAEFILLAEAVEDKYRPMEDEDEDEEGDVVPLPDVEEVQVAKAEGKKSTSFLRRRSPPC